MVQSGSLIAQLVKNLPAMRETWIRSLVWEDPLEKGMATHSSILAWRIPWTSMVHRVTKRQTWLSDFHMVQSRCTHKKVSCFFCCCSVLVFYLSRKWRGASVGSQWELSQGECCVHRMGLEEAVSCPIHPCLSQAEPGFPRVRHVGKRTPV